MSLLNKVLRDLDKRRSEQGTLPLPVAGVQPVAQRPWRRRALMWVGGALAAGVAVVMLKDIMPVGTPAVKPAQQMALVSVPKPSAPLPAPSAEVIVSERLDTREVAPRGQSVAFLNEGLRLVAEIITPIRAVAGVKSESMPRAKLAGTEPTATASRAEPVSPSRVLASSVQTLAMPEPLLVAAIEKNATAPNTREQARAVVEAGLQAMLQKRPDEAVQTFREALELDPGYDRGRQALLSALITLQDKPGAELVADGGVIQGESRVGFALVAARLKLERGAVKDALAVLERERAAGVRHPDYMALWGNALARESRHADAVRMYSAAIELAPTNAAHHVGLAYALRNDGQYASAYAVFESVLAMPGLTPQLTDLVNQQIGALQRLIVQR